MYGTSLSVGLIRSTNFQSFPFSVNVYELRNIHSSYSKLFQLRVVWQGLYLFAYLRLQSQLKQVKMNVFHWTVAFYTSWFVYFFCLIVRRAKSLHNVFVISSADLVDLFETFVRIDFNVPPLKNSFSFINSLNLNFFLSSFKMSCLFIIVYRAHVELVFFIVNSDNVVLS